MTMGERIAHDRVSSHEGHDPRRRASRGRSRCGFAAGESAVASVQDGEYRDKNGDPTYKIGDGNVDWYTYSGYVRYGANCLQCHGPDGLGSSYAPSLVDALKTMAYADFAAIVAGGKQEVGAAQQLPSCPPSARTRT